MITEKDCFWIWETKKDSKQAIKLEKRVKEKCYDEFLRFLGGLIWFRMNKKVRIRIDRKIKELKMSLKEETE